MSEAIHYEYDLGAVKLYDISRWNEDNVAEELLDLNRSRQIRPSERYVRNGGNIWLDKHADTGLQNQILTSKI